MLTLRASSRSSVLLPLLLPLVSHAHLYALPTCTRILSSAASSSASSSSAAASPSSSCIYHIPHRCMARGARMPSMRRVQQQVAEPEPLQMQGPMLDNQVLDSTMMLPLIKEVMRIQAEQKKMNATASLSPGVMEPMRKRDGITMLGGEIGTEAASTSATTSTTAASSSPSTTTPAEVYTSSNPMPDSYVEGRLAPLPKTSGLISGSMEGLRSSRRDREGEEEQNMEVDDDEEDELDENDEDESLESFLTPTGVHELDQEKLERLDLTQEAATRIFQSYAEHTLLPTAKRYRTTVSRLFRDRNHPAHFDLHKFAQQWFTERMTMDISVHEYEEQMANLTDLNRSSTQPAAQRILMYWYPLLLKEIQSIVKTDPIFLPDPREEEWMELYAVAAAAEAPSLSASTPSTSSTSTSSPAYHNPLPPLSLHHSLSLLTPPQLTVLTMHTIFGLILKQPEGMKFTQITNHLGHTLETELKQLWQLRRKKKWKEDTEEWRRKQREIKERERDHMHNQEAAAGFSDAAATAMDESTTSSSSDEFSSTPSSSSSPLPPIELLPFQVWTLPQKVQVGGVLLAAFVRTAGLPLGLVEEMREKRVGFGEKETNTTSSSSSTTSTSTIPDSLLINLTTSEADKIVDRSGELVSTPPPDEQDVEIDADALEAEEEADAQEMGESEEAEAMVRSGGRQKKRADKVTTKDVAALASATSSPPSSSTTTITTTTNTSTDEFTPALFHYFSQVMTGRHTPTARRVGMIRADRRLIELIMDDTQTIKKLLPKMNPMIVQPKNWTTSDDGGYLSISHKIVRAHGVSSLQNSLLKRANLSRVYKCLNYLAAQPWQVNESVWNVVKVLWSEGGGVGDMPSRLDKKLPPLPDRTNIPAYRYYESIKRSNSELYSQRCELLYKFTAAEEYVGRKIYYPYFLDFRGRAYPIPPYLNHTGGDLSRGLLKFAQAKPLGEKGLYWLMVHVATLYGGGVDKRSFTGRVEWVTESMSKIAESMSDPLKNRWWISADKPFQFLAAAMELTAAVKSPNPTKFLSSLPVHTDGSCNGLQHYAALGRDLWGGTCVNLVKAEKPQDVYAQVLDIVVSKLRKEASDSSAPRQQTAQKLLTLKLNRKIVKQAVMTSVYGVTLIGARDQILARLEELPEAVELFGENAKGGVTNAANVTTTISSTPTPANIKGTKNSKLSPPPRPVVDTLPSVALYLAQLTLTSLYDAFSGARRIQTWLGQCSNLLSSVQQPVSWISPIGLPIIQPYRAEKKTQVSTSMQSVALVEQSDNMPVSHSRQRSAFPPNFIHSLDATHMMMTALACERKNITFASVHDSYWTHAGSMEDLSQCLREEFVELYSQPILQQTRENWVRRYPELNFPPVPKTGELDIKEVLKSPYFFN